MHFSGVVNGCEIVNKIPKGSEQAKGRGRVKKISQRSDTCDSFQQKGVKSGEWPRRVAQLGGSAGPGRSGRVPWDELKPAALALGISPASEAAALGRPSGDPFAGLS